MDRVEDQSRVFSASQGSQGALRGQDYLSVEDVAAHLGVKVGTVRAWRERGVLPPANKFGKLVRWPRQDIEAWARQHQEHVGRRRSGPVELKCQSFHEGRKL